MFGSHSINLSRLFLQFCQENHVEYLTMRAYIGTWLLIIALLVASVEGSVFIKVFTRFTEEIFASLISLLYIFESVTNMIFVSIINFFHLLFRFCAPITIIRWKNRGQYFPRLPIFISFICSTK